MPADLQHARFLLIQMMHHGDVLLNTIVADALKQAWPQCTVDMLVYQGMQDVLLDNPAINQVFTVDRNWKKQGALKHAGLEISLANTIRAQRYDVVLNFSNRWRPYSDQATVIWAGDYGELPHPDSIDVNTRERLLTHIPLEAVWQAVEQKLAAI